MFQLRNKSGQFYDRWAAGLARAAAEAERRVQESHEEQRRG